MLLQKYENSTIEYKSLKKVIGKTADLKDLAKNLCMFGKCSGWLSVFRN